MSDDPSGEQGTREGEASGAEMPSGGAAGIDPEFLDLLVCPLGKASLELRDGTLVCTRCGPAFKIVDGIPIMLIDEATLPEGISSPRELPCQREGESSGAESAGDAAAAG